MTVFDVAKVGAMEFYSNWLCVCVLFCEVMYVYSVAIESFNHVRCMS